MFPAVWLNNTTGAKKETGGRVDGALTVHNFRMEKYMMRYAIVLFCIGMSSVLGGISALDGAICYELDFYYPECKVSVTTNDPCNDDNYCDNPCDGTIEYSVCYKIVCMADLCNTGDQSAQCVMSSNPLHCDITGQQEHTVGFCVNFTCPAGQSYNVCDEGSDYDWDEPLDGSQSYDGNCTTI